MKSILKMGVWIVSVLLLLGVAGYGSGPDGNKPTGPESVFQARIANTWG